jgi:NAD-dependent dihydropyrimidine dehydrogenase PreA subunit
VTVVTFIGIKFYLFVSYFEKGMIPDFTRPAGVEAFLPISALVSLKHWFYTGTINRIHPSALVLFLIICFTALIAKKGFCSWVCPIGFVSEFLAKLHSHLFKRNTRLPYILDFMLRTLKYLVAGFFIYQVFYKMPISSIEQFIQSPYNRFADIKMLKFFTQISTTALLILVCLIVLSIFIQNFWCRYLCPYGALIGLIGVFSIGKINRNPSLCTSCGKCEKKCPGNIAIRQEIGINSLECSACLTCVETCPEKGSIQFSLFAGKKPIAPSFLALFFLLIFTGGITLAKSTGNWQNVISKQEYLSYIAPASNTFSSLDGIDPEKMNRMILMMKQFKEQQIRMKDLQKQKGE